MPIILAGGKFVGTHCAIDLRPARLKTPQTIGMFKLFAELIATQVGAIEHLRENEAVLASERENSELRNQFIAVLGHDLRNPLASIDAGIRLVQKAKSPEQTSEVIALMQTSIRRMSKLIDNVLDFARGRLGGGLAIERVIQDVGPVLRQVTDEMRTSSPGSVIETDFALTKPVICDSGRDGMFELYRQLWRANS